MRGRTEQCWAAGEQHGERRCALRAKEEEGRVAWQRGDVLCEARRQVRREYRVILENDSRWQAATIDVAMSETVLESQGEGAVGQACTT